MSLGHHSLLAMAEQMFTTMPMPFLGMHSPWRDGGTRCVGVGRCDTDRRDMLPVPEVPLRPGLTQRTCCSMSANSAPMTR